MNEEQKLVTQVLLGLPGAKENYNTLFYPRLYRACAYLLTHGGREGNAEAKEIADEALLVAHLNLKEHDFRTPLYAWMHRTCVLLCNTRLDHRRRRMLSRDPEKHPRALKRWPWPKYWPRPVSKKKRES